MLYTKSPELIHLLVESLYPLTNVSPFPSPPQPLGTTILLFGSTSLTLLDSTRTWDHTAFVFLCQAYFTHHSSLFHSGQGWEEASGD